MFTRQVLLIASLMAVIKSSTAEEPLMECDDYFVTIDNSTGISFYSTCPKLEFMVGPSHKFSGPFNLSGVQSIGKFSSGYLLPKLPQSQRVDDAVTTVSMPDLLNTTSGGLFFGYLNNLTNIDFPKLNAVNGEIVFIDNYELKNIALPSLTNVTSGVLFDGSFDSISLPALKSVGYIIVKSIGELDCIALGRNLSSVVYTSKEHDTGVGFTCWTPYEKNTYNTSDPKSVSGTSGNGGGKTDPSTTGSAASETSKAASEAGSIVPLRGLSTIVVLAIVASLVGLLL
ncbi:hypothetical protein VTL71DRAFT_13223 [Oculimacula yallundae]|uniref:Uncharacterized protein n=1 Tax=Oculimacula yallundae TaxID=86028 RepID=A0ABR4CKD2_9HELO